MALITKSSGSFDKAGSAEQGLGELKNVGFMLFSWRVIISSLVVLLFSACGKEPAAGGNQPATDPQALDCNAQWQVYLNSYQVGLVKTYETTVASSDGSGSSHTSKHRSRETVKAVSSDSVTYDQLLQMLEPDPGPEFKSEVTVTRDAFVRACENPAETPTDSGEHQAEILEQRNETIKVRAGTFSAKYIKARSTGSAEGQTLETLSEIWTTDDERQLMVKTVVHSTAKSAEVETKSISTTELTELKS